jgi:diacylglycerol kinase family enzyme
MLRSVKRIVLIVNPRASHVTPELTTTVERELRAAGDVETRTTERGGHAIELAREAGREADAIVVFSGDGGYNEVVNGLENDVPVGFVPGGGTSVFARALGLPREARPAARAVAGAILHDRARRVTLGSVNGRRFTFAAGIGVDAELVRRVDALGRSPEGERAGDLAFVRIATGYVAEHRARFEPTLEIQGLGRAAFALVANCDPYSFAGPIALHASREARFELGLDLAAPRRVRPLDVPRLVGYLLTGSPRLRRGVIHAHDLDRVSIVCDGPMPLHADGEDLGDVTEAVLEAQRGALAVLV